MKKSYLKTKIVSVFILFFFTTTFSFAQTDVLVCGAQLTQSWIDDVQTKLIATGNFTSVSTFNLYTGTPTLAYLQGFDAVLIFTDYSCQNGVMFGDSLAAYIDGGGGVVNCVFSTAGIPIGGAFDSTMYQVVISTDQSGGDTLTLGTIHDACHPIMTGITNINGGPASYRSDTNVVLTPGSAYVANWSNGQWLVAEKLNVGPMNARRADLNFFPPSMSVRSDLWDTTSQGGQFMANALLWVAGVINAPVAIVASTSTVMCVDDADAILTGTPVGGTWSGTGVIGITFDPTIAGPGTHYAHYMQTDANGCTVSDSIAIVVNALSVVANSTASAVCDGSPVTLTGSGATSYTWTNSVTDGSPFVPVSTMTYTVTGTGSNGCQATDEVTVTVNPNPNVTGTSSALVMCLDDEMATLTGFPVGGIWFGVGVIGTSFDPSIAGIGTSNLPYTYTDANGCSGSTAITLTVNACVGVNENSLENGVSVFPNPNNGDFTISINAAVGDIQIEVLDMQGRVVYASKENNVQAGFTNRILLNEMANGIYIIRLTTAEAQQLSKVSVQK